MKQFRNEYGEIVEALDEFDLYGAVERDQLIEYVEFVEEAALAELAEFGNLEFEPQFNWYAKSEPWERGWSRAMFDIMDELGTDISEPLFELF